MVKSIEKFLSSSRHDIHKRRFRALKKLNEDADQLIKDICSWYQIDENGEVSITSTKILDGKGTPSDQMDQHKHFYNVVNDRLAKILGHKNSLLQNCTKRSLTELLENIEKEITSTVHRILQKKRRTDMNMICMFERMKNKTKVHNFTTRTIDKGLMLLLSKGPSTIPREPIPIYKRQEEAKKYLTDVLKQTVGCSSTHPNLTPLGLEINRPGITPLQREHAEDNIGFIQDFIQNMPDTQNLEESSKVMAHLYNLSRNSEIIVNTADKNLGFVINNTSWYLRELYRQLSDTNTYREIHGTTKEELIQISQSNITKLIHRLEHIHTKSSELAALKNCTKNDLKLPSLNLLPKIHKLKSLPNPENENILKGRPILNGFNFTTSAVSRIFDDYMMHITRKLKDLFQSSNITFPCIKNSDELINTLNSLPKLDTHDLTNIWLITFDFESLYTNITSDYVYEMLNSAQRHQFISSNEHQRCMLLYEFMQNNNFFHIGHKKFYRQTNGLSMGSYDAQDTSNNVLLFHEFQLLLDREIQEHTIFYVRYIDDGFVAVIGDISIVNMITSKISWVMPNKIPIEFSIKKFSNNFLDLWIKLDYNSFVTKDFSYHIYQKEFNSYSYIHRSSNHPRYIFNGIIKTENIRYDRKCNSYLERAHIGRLFKIRLYKQGYKFQECMYNRKNKRAKPEIDIGCKKLIRIVFNKSHGLNLAAKSIVRKSKYHRNRKLMTVNKNNKKLKEILLTKKQLHNKIGKLL